MRGLLDTGRMSWGLNDEHVYTCPCGAWQLHVPSGAAMLFMDPAPAAESVPDLMPWIMTGTRALNAAMDDALWEHETECAVLQHAAVQAGIVRGSSRHPYIWTPNEYEARYDMLSEKDS